MSKITITITKYGVGATPANSASFEGGEVKDIVQVVKDEGGCLTDKILPLLLNVGAVPERNFDVFVRLDIEAVSLEDAEQKADDAICGLDFHAYVDDIVDSE